MKHIGVILVGGKGRRLGSLTKKTAKPLIKINDLPFLKILLYNICKFKFKIIYLICSYKSSQFFKDYNNRYIFGVKIICLMEKRAKDTGGALYEVKKKISKDFFLINGDTFFNINYDAFYNFAQKTKTEINIALVKNTNYKSNKKLSRINLNKNNIINYNDNNKKSEFMNGGIYYIKKTFLKKIKNQKISLEKDILKNNIIINNVSGKIFNNYFIDIGLKKNLNKARKEIGLYNFNKCIFLDRDGVINYDNGYTYKIKDLRLFPEISKLINYLNLKKFLVIVITNQSGIGRGYYTEKQFKLFNKKIEEKLAAKNAYIDDIFFCPHHSKYALSNYKKNCSCRKPKPGMLLMAKKKWSITFGKSLMIGDSISDQIASKKMNIKFFYNNKYIFNKIKSYIKLKKI